MTFNPSRSASLFSVLCLVFLLGCSANLHSAGTNQNASSNNGGAAAVGGGMSSQNTSNGGTTSLPSNGGTTVACAGSQHNPDGPDGWGGCWPGPTTTGVPPGTNLTAYTGSCTITTNNTVIDSKKINCDLQIKAANVKITKSLITGSVATDENSTGFSFEITDSEVNAGDRAATGIGAVNFVARRVHVYGGNRSIHCWHDCTIADSYVHGQFTDPSGTFHESGMRMGQSANITHNAIFCDAPDVPPDGGCSADLTGYGDFGPVQNNNIYRNLFGATTGGFCTYGGSSQGKPYSSQANHIVFTENIWQRGKRKDDHGGYSCGYYGSNTAFDPTRPGNVWQDNFFDDGTAVMSAN